MALPPTIPTSFVPRSSSAQHIRTDFTGAFRFFMYAALFVVMLLALGVFVYENMLTTTQQAKKADVVQKQKDLQVETVEEFVRLQNRLTTSAALLDAHPAYSKFFSALETMIPATVRFTSLNISRDEAGVPKITASGLAKSFNALASASDALASDNRLKDAIFSGISINSNGSVSFSLTATLDPKIIAFTQDAPVEPSVQEEATPEEPPLEELP